MGLSEKKVGKQESLFIGVTKVEKIVSAIKNANAIVIGAGAGMSASAGLTYSGSRFTDNFQEFIKRYGIRDMYSAGFYPFPTQEEKWAYWSRHINMNRYEFPAGKPYTDLLSIIKEKEFFVITTNVDHQFQKSGFSEDKMFATQGDYGLFQCSLACHKKLYSNEAQIKEMVKVQKDCKIPSELVPKCPVCGCDMTINIRSDEYFIEDEAWEVAASNYEAFLEKYKSEKLLFLELGVGMNTPAIIKYPFWQMTNSFRNPGYVCLNLNESYAPDEIKNKSICVDNDITAELEIIKENM